jgi:polyvinyl alcohol dehydrogenase (cytochrome)
MRPVAALVALVLLAIPVRDARAGIVDRPLSGRRLILRDDGGGTRRLAIRSTDGGIGIGGGDDPTIVGASLRVRSGVVGGFDGFYQLPRTGWRLIGNPGENKGFKFTDRAGPIERAVVRPGHLLQVVGRGPLAQTLATDPDPVTVVLQVGGRRHCMNFGGRTRFVAGTRFSATNAPPPPSCPALVDWPTYGFDLARSRFNPEEGLINRNTVQGLEARWFFSTGTGTGAVSASPTVVGGVVYVGSWNGTMYALDAITGDPIWTFDIADPNPGARGGFPGIQSSAAVAEGKVYFGGADANVYALDAQTGVLAWKTALGDPDPTVEGAHVWSSPAVFDGKVYVGKSSHLDNPCVRGSVVALDAGTGNETWRFDALPERICGTDTRHPCTSDSDCSGSACGAFLVCRSGSGGQAQSHLCATDADCTAPATCQRPLGGGVTSSPTIDATSGVVFVSVGDCVGSGATGFSEAIVALDAETGAVRWTFAPVPPGDLGDLDFVASPNLFSATVGTSVQRLVGAGSKDGIYYVVDRDTGAAVWQRMVVGGGVFGGFNASTGVAAGLIYGGTFTGPPFEFALVTSDGALAWQCPASECSSFSFGPPGIAPGVVFLGDGTGMLRAFDADTGALLRKLDLGGAISSGPAVVNGMVIVGAGTGGFGGGHVQGVYGLALQ